MKMKCLVTILNKLRITISWFKTDQDCQDQRSDDFETTKQNNMNLQEVQTKCELLQSVYTHIYIYI